MDHDLSTRQSCPHVDIQANILVRRRVGAQRRAVMGVCGRIAGWEGPRPRHGAGRGTPSCTAPPRRLSSRGADALIKHNIGDVDRLVIRARPAALSAWKGGARQGGHDGAHKAHARHACACRVDRGHASPPILLSRSRRRRSCPLQHYLYRAPRAKLEGLTHPEPVRPSPRPMGTGPRRLRPPRAGTPPALVRRRAAGQLARGGGPVSHGPAAWDASPPCARERSTTAAPADVSFS